MRLVVYTSALLSDTTLCDYKELNARRQQMRKWVEGTKRDPSRIIQRATSFLRDLQTAGCPSLAPVRMMLSLQQTLNP